MVLKSCIPAVTPKLGMVDILLVCCIYHKDLIYKIHMRSIGDFHARLLSLSGMTDSPATALMDSMSWSQHGFRNGAIRKRGWKMSDSIDADCSHLPHIAVSSAPSWLSGQPLGNVTSQAHHRNGGLPLEPSMAPVLTRDD